MERIAVIQALESAYTQHVRQGEFHKLVATSLLSAVIGVRAGELTDTELKQVLTEQVEAARDAREEATKAGDEAEAKRQTDRWAAFTRARGVLHEALKKDTSPV